MHKDELLRYLCNHSNCDTEIQHTESPMVNEGFWEWNLVSDKLYLSVFCREFTGYTTDDTSFDTNFLKSIILPDDQQEFFDAVRFRSKDTPDVSSIGFRLLTRDGIVRWAECSFSVVEFDENGNATRVMGRLVDTTERRQTKKQLHNLNRALLAISSCNHALLRANNEVQLLNDICQIIVEVGGYRMAWVGYAQDDPEKSVLPIAQAGFVDGYLDVINISWDDVDRGRGPTGTTIRTGTLSLVYNIQQSNIVDLWKPAAEKRGYASILSLPLKNDQKVFGALTIYSTTPEIFKAE
jgi:PAS domain S-box-containing protein